MRTALTTHEPGVANRLRKTILADGMISGAFGVMLIAAAGPLSELLGLSVAFLRWTGVLLLPWAIALLLLANRPDTSRPGVRAVIGVNLAWVAASFLILMLGWIEPTGVGAAFVISQALLVGVFAELQIVGLRRIR